MMSYTDFSFKCAHAAPGAFANHVKYRDTEKKRKRSRKHRNLTEEGHWPDDKDGENTNESTADTSTPLDPDQLKAGNRVAVLCKDGYDWLVPYGGTTRRNDRKGS